MKKKMSNAIRTFIVLIGALIGPFIYLVVSSVSKELGFGDITELLLPGVSLAIIIASGIITGLIFYFISPKMIKRLNRFEQRIKNAPTKDIAVSVIGLIIGLFIAFLLSRLVDMIPISFLTVPISVILYIMLGYIGISVALFKREDLNLGSFFRRGSKDEHKKDCVNPKVLDTSAIIDGRIYEIAKTGFLDGSIYVPSFVLTELRHIADSADELKRNRGRRGLDILQQMQDNLPQKVIVLNKDYDDIAEVDSKLLKLGSDMGASVVTNDYNLNKVAGVQGVKVLNVNELANAVKPVALPGEVMVVKIVKEGKEQQQGVGFLSDGTMIVVQDAKRRIGETLNVEVTSSLQTAAGRMIFARIVQ